MRIQQATLTAAATLTSVVSPLAMVVGAILFAAHASWARASTWPAAKSGSEHVTAKWFGRRHPHFAIQARGVTNRARCPTAGHLRGNAQPSPQE